MKRPTVDGYRDNATRDNVSASCWAGYHEGDKEGCSGLGIFSGVAERCLCDCHEARRAAARADTREEG